MNINMDAVPLTATEALVMFVAALTNEEKKALKEVEETHIALFHHTWGQDIRNAWSMWEKDTPLVNSFKQLGITHPDDMSEIVMTCAWRQLNKKPIKLQDQIKSHQEYWIKEIGKPMP